MYHMRWVFMGQLLVGLSNIRIKCGIKYSIFVFVNHLKEDAPNWTFEEYAEGLRHPLAEHQFAADLEALEHADTCVLELPCGRSAHTEAGWPHKFRQIPS